MSNHLPPELVQQIIESSVPSTNDWSTYYDRQAPLRSLCLVCRLFRDIAQPLLFEIVWINGQRKLDALLNTLESKEPGFIICEAIFEESFKQRLSAGNLERTLRSCHSLRSLILQLEYNARSDLSVLQDLPRKPFRCIINEKLFTLAESTLAPFQTWRIFLSSVQIISSHPASDFARSRLSASTTLLSESLPPYSTLWFYLAYDHSY